MNIYNIYKTRWGTPRAPRIKYLAHEMNDYN